MSYWSCTVLSGENEPVVFLLGWVGSKDKHIAKYSSIYENEGCITIRYIHPQDSVFLTDPNESKSHKMVSVKLVQLLEDYDLLENPVFVHAFSNGGYFVYRYMADVLQNRNINVAGAIFDSCPSELECWVGIKAIYNSRAFPNMFVTFLVSVAFSVFYLFMSLKRLFRFGPKLDVFQTMKQSSTHLWPNLYLYSSADVIIPARHIEGMANARLTAGVPFVQKHNFHTSPHVMHFKMFPDEYARECVEFFQKCLSLSKDKSDSIEQHLR